MDFLVELVVQIVLQVVVEFVFEVLAEGAFRGVAYALRSRVGRYLISGLVGTGFGIGWGTHLSGGPHLPRLLWVSAGLAVAGVLAVIFRRGAPPERNAKPDWREALSPPWRWSADRLVAFVALNVGLAVGIVIGFGPGRG